MSDVELAAVCVGLNPIQVEQFRLRPFTYSDLGALHAILSSRDDMTWERLKATQEYSERLLSFRLQHYSDHKFGIMAIEDGAGRLVGQAGFQVLHDLVPDCVELVVFLSAGAIGRGNGRKLTEHMTEQARRCGLTSVYATVRHENEPADRLVRKLGFRFVAEATHFGQACGLWRLPLR